MAGKKFRVISIRFDEDERVSKVVARCEGDVFALITEILGEGRTNYMDLRGGEVRLLNLPVTTAMELMRVCRKMRGDDPRYRNGGDAISESLWWVYCSLLDES